MSITTVKKVTTPTWNYFLKKLNEYIQNKIYFISKLNIKFIIHQILNGTKTNFK